LGVLGDLADRLCREACYASCEVVDLADSLVGSGSKDHGLVVRPCLVHESLGASQHLIADEARGGDYETRRGCGILNETRVFVCRMAGHVEVVFGHGLNLDTLAIGGHDDFDRVYVRVSELTGGAKQ
jgi:hypothetical protein